MKCKFQKRGSSFHQPLVMSELHLSCKPEIAPLSLYRVLCHPLFTQMIVGIKSVNARGEMKEVFLGIKAKG